MNERLSILLLAVVGSVACGEEHFFPDGALGRNPKSHDSTHNWYAGMLRAFDEPSLMTEVEKGRTKQKTIYRFTWLRSFDEPICVKIVAGDSLAMTAKVLDGKGGYEPGKLKIKKTIELPRETFQQFQSLLGDADYRSMTPRTTFEGAWFWSPEHNSWLQRAGSGLDGAQWILEYCSGNEYFFVDRWSASKSRFGKACLYLVELAGLDVEDVY